MVAHAAARWDDASTAQAYEAFCRRHRRYRRANAALVAHAALAPGQRVLDVAAGTGRTAEAALPRIGPGGSILCVEPAGAMRARGAERVRDPRVRWTSRLPDAARRYDRVLCGAAIWQLAPLDASFARLAALLAPRGALVFNIPAHYLLEPDAPGGGRDPWLVELPALVERHRAAAEEVPGAGAGAVPARPPSADDVARLLADAGLRAERWSFEVRISQAAYRDWLKIPPVSEGLFPGLPPSERARRLDDAYHHADHASWRRERWLGWTSWRDA